MEEYKVVKLDKTVSVTLEEVRNKLGLNKAQMARRLGIDRSEYSRAEHGDAPEWMRKAAIWFEICFEAGYLPDQVALPPKEEKSQQAKIFNNQRQYSADVDKTPVKS
jgi:transcriptional regulator with XRE-family HTH domain